MDRSRLSLLPHHSWFGFSFEMPPATTVAHESRETNHTVAIGTASAVDVQWIHRVCERLYRHGLDQVAFFASDNDVHTRVIRSGEAPSSSYLLKIPRWHLIDLAGSDEADMLSTYLAALVGHSPSHCARKFRYTEGLSLGRFVNRRRLAKALVVLRRDSTPLSQVALALGFSSQSHFTRLFSEVVGMTPAKYRKTFKPTVG